MQIFQDSDLSEFSLLSVAQFCDEGCTAHYDRHRVWITNQDGKEILTGNRDSTTGLYMVDLTEEEIHTQIAAPVIRSNPIAQRVAYWAASMGAPVTDTLLRAMRNGYVTCPGISTSDVVQHPPDFTATSKGHMTMKRQGLQPTHYHQSPATEDELFPEPLPSLGPGKQRIADSHSSVCTRCIPMSQEHFSDMAGRFPFKSFTGAEYMLIMFCTDANYIHCEKMNSRSGKEYARAYQQGITFFNDRGITPKWERLDNEKSSDLTAVAKNWE